MTAAPERPVEAPVRVMHVVHTFSVGGMEVGLAKLVNGLSPARVASSICSTRPCDSLRERLRADIGFFECGGRQGNDPAVVGRLYRLFRQQRPDVVHTHAWGTLLEGLAAAKLARVPCVVHGEHGTLDARPLNARVQRWAWGRADRVLSVSSRLAERMSARIGFPVERIQVIRNGVDLERFAPRDRAAAKEALGLPAGEVAIGTAGRLVAVKDHSTLLRALAILHRHGARFSAVIAGDGPLQGDLSRLASELGLATLRLLGNRPDIERVFSALDVFVLSSISEGLSNTIQEAMASGVPVVATRVGGADELVEESQTGLLVPSGDPPALAAALRALATDAPRREAMGAAGRRRAEAHFGLGGMVRAYEALYGSLVHRGARPMTE